MATTEPRCEPRLHSHMGLCFNAGLAAGREQVRTALVGHLEAEDLAWLWERMGWDQ